MQSWQEQNQRTLARAVGLLRATPFVEMIALTGSMAEGRARAESDIDLFIQTKPGRIWTTRVMVTVIIQLAGIRRTETKIVGRICLNWYATFNAPAQQAGRIYQIICQVDTQPITRRLLEIVLGGSFGTLIESLARWYQTHRIERDQRAHQPGSQVRYSDTELGFHPPKKM
jgi:predicted nucleotidyltransferase